MPRSMIYDKLNREFKFTHDPCPAGGIEAALLDPSADGLLAAWGLSNYVNPPLLTKGTVAGEDPEGAGPGQSKRAAVTGQHQ